MPPTHGGGRGPEAAPHTTHADTVPPRTDTPSIPTRHEWADALRASTLTPPAKAVLNAFLRWYPKNGATFYRSLKDLVIDTGFSRSTVKRHRQILEDSGWLIPDPDNPGHQHEAPRYWPGVPRGVTPTPLDESQRGHADPSETSSDPSGPESRGVTVHGRGVTLTPLDPLRGVTLTPNQEKNTQKNRPADTAAAPSGAAPADDPADDDAIIWPEDDLDAILDEYRAEYARLYCRPPTDDETNTVAYFMQTTYWFTRSLDDTRECAIDCADHGNIAGFMARITRDAEPVAV